MDMHPMTHLTQMGEIAGGMDKRLPRYIKTTTSNKTQQQQPLDGGLNVRLNERRSTVQ